MNSRRRIESKQEKFEIFAPNQKEPLLRILKNILQIFYWKIILKKIIIIFVIVKVEWSELIEGSEILQISIIIIIIIIVIIDIIFRMQFCLMIKPAIL